MTDVFPASVEDVNAWRDHMGDSTKITAIIKSELTNQETLRQIVLEGKFNSHSRSPGYTGVYVSMLDNPNVDEQFKQWLDTHPTSIGTYDSRNYWLKRYNIAWASPDSPYQSSFSLELISGGLLFESACREILSCSGNFIMYMWHDLALQGDISFSYRRDDYIGDYMYAMMHGIVPDLHESLSEMFTIPAWDITWLTKTPWIFEKEAVVEDIASGAEDVLTDVGLAAFCEELESEKAESLEDGYVSGYALAFGQTKGDLEIIDYSHLIPLAGDGMLDFEVEVTGDVYWNGLRYEELSAEQQKHLALNIHTSSTHPFIGQFAWYLLACMAMHDKTHESVIETLKSFGLEQLAAAFGSRA